MGSHRQVADEAPARWLLASNYRKCRDILLSLRSFQPLRAIEGHFVSRLLTFRFIGNGKCFCVESTLAGHEKKKKVVNTTACRSTGDVYQEASSSIEVALGMCAAVPAQSDLIRSHKLWTASTSRLCNLRRGFVDVPAFLNENKNKLTQLRSPIE